MPIRLRIAFSTAILMVISLLILGTGIYLTMSRNLDDDLDGRLRTVYEGFRGNPGNFTFREGRITLDPIPDPFASTGAFIQIRQPDGTVADRSENLGAADIPVSAQVLERNERFQLASYNAEIDGKPVRVLSGPLVLSAGEPDAYVQVAEYTAPIDQTLTQLKRNLIVGSIMATIVLTLGAWLIGDAALRPLSTMSSTARTIGRTRDLSQRLDPPNTRDEVEYLAETFNDMLARLEETFNAQRRFVADASHELRTPLTALRANSDIMLRQIESGMFARDDLLEGLTDVRDEVDRMTRLVQNLLTLARADVGWRPEMETIDLAETIRDAARIASALNRGQQLDIVAPLNDDDENDIEVYGNEDQIRQLVLILLDNAFTYTPDDTVVTLSMSREDGNAVIVVADNGPGISAEHVQNVFERFYRADSSRARSSGGSGLGLSIARWIVSVHGGSIDVTSADGAGTTFTIRLPITPTGASRATGFLRRSRTESSLAPS